jgi:hypothetical protein
MPAALILIWSLLGFLSPQPSSFEGLFLGILPAEWALLTIVMKHKASVFLTSLWACQSFVKRSH